MAKKSSKYEQSDIAVVRRSDATRQDFLCSATDLAARIDLTPPRFSQLISSADLEVVGRRGNTKLFWCVESLSRIARWYAPAKQKNGEKQPKKHTEIENEKVGALEARRIRQLDVKIAKDEKEWVPSDVAIESILTFQTDARSIFTSCVPLLRQKFGDKIPPDVLQNIDTHLSTTYNLSCDIDFDMGEFTTYESEENVDAVDSEAE